MLSIKFVSLFALLLTLTGNVFSTRTPQYCRHRGSNGKAEICLAVNTFYNTTTQASDFYLTLRTFRYKSSKKGWAAMGFGNQMTGALMFLIYGDPELDEMTVSLRTATGHHPIGMITDPAFYGGPIPDIQVADAKWEEYTGGYINEELGFAPSHMGTAHIVCYDCLKWTGFAISNTSTMSNMIWGTNWLQDMRGDFGNERQIDAHKMGLGFGPLWVDMLHAQITTETAHFPVLNGAFTDKGVNEIGLEPSPPVDAELDPIESSVVPDPAPTKVEDTKPAPPPTESPAAPAEVTQATESDTAPIQPVRTLLGLTIRDWMWHLHGMLMCLAFLLLYPLGATLIRTSDARAFNFHWTTQAFASLLVAIGGLIGYWLSRSVSVPHQYFGIAIMLAIVAQILLGWRHHVSYLKVARKTVMIRVHTWLGRAIFVSGFVNIIMGLLLRRYTQWVIFLACAVMLLEVVLMLYILGRKEILKLAKVPGSRTRNRDVYGGGAEEGMTAREAEEYFQLTAGDDDEDALSEDGGEARLTREEEKREQQRRLARIDRS